MFKLPSKTHYRTVPKTVILALILHEASSSYYATRISSCMFYGNCSSCSPLAPLFCVTDLLEAPDKEDIEPIRKAKTFYASCMNTRNFIQHYSLKLFKIEF